MQAAVLSGNRNFESRVHPLVSAAYLASPPLVVAFALAGRADIDLTKEPIAISKKTNEPVYLSDLWSVSWCGSPLPLPVCRPIYLCHWQDASRVAGGMPGVAFCRLCPIAHKSHGCC